MTYKADPVAEEMQLLGQLVPAPISITHAATRAIANRLAFSGLVMSWHDSEGRTWIEITNAGMQRLAGAR
ncbi:MAG: hypothetical protein ACO1OK_06435 [Devosia sp.]